MKAFSTKYKDAVCSQKPEKEWQISNGWSQKKGFVEDFSNQHNIKTIKQYKYKLKAIKKTIKKNN